MEQPFLLSRWRGYHDTLQIYDFVEKFSLKYPQQPCYLALPFNALKDLQQKISSELIVMGAEHMNSVSEGEFTSTVAASMLKKAGANFVMIGTFDQRRLFGETNADVHDKLLHALEYKLKPILCLQAEADLEQELREGIGNFNAEQIGQIYLLLEATGVENPFKRPTHEELLKIYKDFSALAEKILGDAFSSAKILYSVPLDIDRFTDLFLEQPAAGFYSPSPEFFVNLLHQDLQLQKISLPEPVEEIAEVVEPSSEALLENRSLETLDTMGKILEEEKVTPEEAEIKESGFFEVMMEPEGSEKPKEDSEETAIEDRKIESKEHLDKMFDTPEVSFEAAAIEDRKIEHEIDAGQDHSGAFSPGTIDAEEISESLKSEEPEVLIDENDLTSETPSADEVRIHTVGDITKKAKLKE